MESTDLSKSIKQYRINKRKKRSLRRNIYYDCKSRGDLLFLKKYYYYKFLQSEYDIEFNLKLYEDKFCYRFLWTPKRIDKIILKEFKNERMRLYRCQKRLESMFQFSDNLWFLTFTIDNKNIDKYQNNLDLFISYITNFFRDTRGIFIDYVYNLDFGKINGRLHAHCVCSTYVDRLDFNIINSYYKIGNLDIIKCYNDNSLVITRYINKLSYHAFKDTAYLQCHYSRKRKKN